MHVDNNTTKHNTKHSALSFDVQSPLSDQKLSKEAALKQVSFIQCDLEQDYTSFSQYNKTEDSTEAQLDDIILEPTSLPSDCSIRKENPNTNSPFASKDTSPSNITNFIQTKGISNFSSVKAVDTIVSVSAAIPETNAVQLLAVPQEMPSPTRKFPSCTVLPVYTGTIMLDTDGHHSVKTKCIFGRSKSYDLNHI